MEPSRNTVESPGISAPSATGPIAGQSAEAPRLSLATLSVSRIAAGVWGLAAIIWILFSGSAAAWTALLAPSIVACVWLLLRSEPLTAWVERRQGTLQAASARAAAKTGKLSKYFSRPLYRGCLWIWKKTEPVNDCHVRAGLRVCALLYFCAAMFCAALFVGYIVIAILFVVAVVLLILWIAGKMSAGDTPDTDGSRGVTAFGRLRPAQSRPSRDLLGNPRTDVFDGTGKKVAEVRPTTHFLGDPKEEVFNTSGSKIGERRPTVDFLGDPKIAECNARGERLGESRPGVDWLGDPVEKHLDNDGKQVGESRPDKDLLGNPIVRHEWKDGK